MASLKVEFATVRELEKKTSKIFIYGGAGVVAGIILIFMFPPIGFLITALSLAAVLGGMIYVGMLAKEPSRPLFCPYCSTKNDVYVSRTEFDCDICHRPIIVDENGMAVMAEEIDLTPRHNQPK
ncbi:MAG: hypothetical protein GX139_00935 [Armatimonadetes bacterium]|jgi:hypothetical protein|nr:hypothetical protein [Armatimonadota bacterium]